MTTIVTRAGKGSALTHTELDNNFTNLNTDKVEASGDSMTGNLSFGDNNKAVFGAGSDLQIYHDGSNSYIEDAGVGSLIIDGSSSTQIKGSSFVILRSSAGENMAVGNANGAFDVYYDGAKKLATTSTGIDVTGTVTADGLTVEKSFNATITLSDTTSVNQKTDLIHNGNNLQIISGGDGVFGGHIISSYNGTDTQNRIVIANNGDINFYEDTGTTAKFYWDASAESLGIGTTSITAGRTLETKGGRVRFDNTVDAYHIDLAVNGNTYAYIGSDTDNHLVFYNGSGTERMRIDSSGKVGIGTTSPSSILHVASNGEAKVTIQGDVNNDAGEEGALLEFITDGTAVRHVIGQEGGTANDLSIMAGEGALSTIASQIIFKTKTTGTTTSSEAARIDSSRNLLVGKTSTNLSSTGTEFRENGLFGATRSGGVIGYFNRLASDGRILEFQKDNTTVGSIGTLGGELYIASDDVGLQFDASGNNILPYGGGFQDGVIDLGESAQRFKDLYLSGGVVFGSTGGAVSSKTLDDYEEGTWIPTLEGNTSGSISSFTVSAANYTKIGNTVHVFMFLSSIDTTSHNMVGAFLIKGLPFTPSANRQSISVSNCSLFSFDEISTSVSGYASASSLAFVLQKGSSNTTIQGASDVLSGTGLTIMVGATYHTI